MLKDYVCKECKKEFFYKPSKSRIYCSRKCRGIGERKRVNRICQLCSKKFEATPFQIVHKGAKYCSQSCYQKVPKLKGKDHHAWKGGRYIGNKGYMIINIDGKEIFEHRVVMERILKRKLKSSEHVHHINGKKADNRPENLIVFSSPKEHTEFGQLHCLKCGKPCSYCSK